MTTRPLAALLVALLVAIAVACPAGGPRAAGPRIVDIRVTSAGYEPAQVELVAG